MIIDNTYFKGEIYIPNAKPSVTSGVIGISSDVQIYIDQYVRECLEKSLGVILAQEFIDQLDSSETNGLKAGADQKWDDLLNGETYTDKDGNERIWKGIRFKNSTTGDYDRSFLAYYVYWFYESGTYHINTNAGNAVVEAKNAEIVPPTHKMTNAWRKFFEMVQDNSTFPTYYERRGLIGVDYYGIEDKPTTLYQFITDKNNLVEDTYEDFKPKRWKNLNQFGI